MSKEKQIEEEAELLAIIENAREVYANDITDHTENEYIRESLLNAGYRKQSEWISVEERLPDPTKNVLVCKTFLGKPYIDIGCVKDAETCCCASDEFIIKPWLHELTHWMPLPKPPKMKGK